jgi:hypothetical protein
MAFFSKFAAFHVDVSHGRAQFNGGSSTLGEARIAGAWCRWPAVTVAYTNSAYWPHPTAYVAPDSAGLHPQLYSNLHGVEVQGRWPDDRRVHFIATAGVGSLETQYEFWRLKPLEQRKINDFTDHVVEGRSTSHYADASVGAELTIAKLLRLYSLVGVRRSGTIDTPEVSASPFNGAFATVTLGFGKFR